MNLVSTSQRITPTLAFAFYG